MGAFVDPRTEPVSSPRRRRAPTTADPESLAELHGLCREGHLYEVERWIKAGRPPAQGATSAVRWIWKQVR